MATRIKMNAAVVKDLLLSTEVEGFLSGLADPVVSAAESDPNPVYADSIRKTVHRSAGGKPRVSVRVGAAPFIGMAVEAKRGTLARALGQAGG